MRRWLPTLWLGFVVARYGATTLKAIRTPVSPGLDIEWLAAWLAFMLLIALSAILLSRRTVYYLWLGLISATSIVGLVFSHTWLSALTAVIILCIAAGLGEFGLRRLGIEPTGILERIAITVPAGMGFIALAQLTIALMHLFSSTTSLILLGVLAIPAASGLRAIAHQPIEREIGENPLLIVPLGGIFLLNLMWAMAPEVQYDALSVHLAVPRIYLERGAVVDLPYFFHSYFVHLMDMVFGLCLAVGGALVAKFLVLGLGVVAAAGVFALGRILFNGNVGAWSALIFYSTPLIIWLSGTTYIDLAETCFILGAILAFIRFWETSTQGWLIASGWVAGVAVGAKLHALTILGILPIAAAWRAWKDGRRPGRIVLIYASAIAIVATPWYALIYAYTGNPIYPFMNAFFQSPQWDFENTSLDARNFGIGSSLSSLLRLPFWLTWDSKRFGDGLPQGGVGLALLIAFPMALVFLLPKRLRGSWSGDRSDLVRLLLACIALHFTLWAFSFQYGRYYIPVVPLAAVVGVGALLTGSHVNREWNRCLLFVCVLAQAPLASLMFWNIPDRFPIEHALGRESAEHLLSRGLVGYDAASFTNMEIRPGEKVLGVGAENLRFYLNAPLYTLSETSRGHELLRIADTKPDQALASALAASGFAYLLTPVTDLKRPAEYYTYLQPDFIRRFAREVYRDHDFVVLKLCAKEC